MERNKLSERADYKSVDHERLDKANIGERYWFADLARGRAEDAAYAKRLREYVLDLHKHERSGYGVLLWGKHGSGKTSAASRLLIEAMARGPIQVRFETVDDIEWYARNRNETTKEGARIWDLLTRDTQFLVIDDLGAEDDAEWKAPALANVLSQRYNRLLTTILSSNLDPELLAERCPRVGQLVDSYMTVEVCGVDWRVT